MNIYLLVIMVLVHGYNCEITPTSMPTSIPSFRPSLRPLAKSSAMPLPNYNIVIFGIGSSLFVFSMCAYKLFTFLGSSPKVTPLSQEKYLDIDFQENNDVL
jgi:hypothetical protein